MASTAEPQSFVGLLLQPHIFPFFLLAVLYTAIKFIDRTNVPKIKGLPEVPGVPILGNLRQLGDNHPVNAREMAKKYGPVFQVRLGNRRVVFANSFDSVKNLWITNQSALISRPTLHTFHTVVSSSEGLTIGASPWDESCKARRKAAASALNRPAVASYMPILDYESTKSIKEVFHDSNYGQHDVDISLYFSRFALSTSLTLNYGYKIEGNIDDELLKEIVHVEREISNFRSTATNWADYIPLMRLLPGKNDKALQYKARRAKYMWKLLNGLKERMAEGKDKPCISGNVLKDPEAKLSEAEVMSIGLSMTSAGLDTVPANLIMGVAYLSSPHGQEIQQRAYAEILAQYPNNDAWKGCVVEEKCAYITALVKETLRFWSVLPISLPRRSVKPIIWNHNGTNVTIPAGTDFYMNAFAAHYDDTHFKDPYTFAPERYLTDTSVDDALATRGTPHYGFGAGSRMCIGSHLANRELYTAFIKLITAFEIVEAKDPRERPVLDCMGCNALPNGLTMDPKPFKIGLRPRNRELLAEWIRESEERTKDL